MIGQRRRKIINIASVAGLRGAPLEFQAIGNHASKGGVISCTKVLACKWGIHSIQVIAIAPGWFPTHMSDIVIERDTETFRKRIPSAGSGANMI
jgi:NAD(P)-dependent dehydrogenase (short-subunit alcohol dehydrogenase family)